MEAGFDGVIMSKDKDHQVKQLRKDIAKLTTERDYLLRVNEDLARQCDETNEKLKALRKLYTTKKEKVS